MPRVSAAHGSVPKHDSKCADQITALKGSEPEHFGRKLVTFLKAVLDFFLGPLSSLLGGLWRIARRPTPHLKRGLYSPQPETRLDSFRADSNKSRRRLKSSTSLKRGKSNNVTTPIIGKKTGIKQTTPATSSPAKKDIAEPNINALVSLKPVGPMIENGAAENFKAETPFVLFTDSSITSSEKPIIASERTGNTLPKKGNLAKSDAQRNGRKAQVSEVTRVARSNAARLCASSATREHTWRLDWVPKAFGEIVSDNKNPVKLSSCDLQAAKHRDESSSRVLPEDSKGTAPQEASPLKTSSHTLPLWSEPSTDPETRGESGACTPVDRRSITTPSTHVQECATKKKPQLSESCHTSADITPETSKRSPNPPRNRWEVPLFPRSIVKPLSQQTILSSSGASFNLEEFPQIREKCTTTAKTSKEKYSKNRRHTMGRHAGHQYRHHPYQSSSKWGGSSGRHSAKRGRSGRVVRNWRIKSLSASSPLDNREFIYGYFPNMSQAETNSFEPHNLSPFRGVVSYYENTHAGSAIFPTCFQSFVDPIFSHDPAFEGNLGDSFCMPILDTSNYSEYSYPPPCLPYPISQDAMAPPGPMPQDPQYSCATLEELVEDLNILRERLHNLTTRETAADLGHEDDQVRSADMEIVREEIEHYEKLVKDRLAIASQIGACGYHQVDPQGGLRTNSCQEGLHPADITLEPSAENSPIPQASFIDQGSDAAGIEACVVPVAQDLRSDRNPCIVDGTGKSAVEESEPEKCSLELGGYHQHRSYSITGCEAPPLKPSNSDVWVCERSAGTSHPK